MTISGAVAVDGVSVVLIVKNGAPTLARALRSVVSQDPAPLEIIVVDGDSTDDSREIASGFPIVRVIRQSSRGIGAAYNEGVAASRGSLVAFISCDDLWRPGKLARQTEFLRAHPEALAVLTHCIHTLLEKATPAAGFRLDLLDRPVPGWIMETLVARRAAFERIGRFDEQLPIAEDTDWFARARDAGIALAMLPDVLVEKGVHSRNTSVTQGESSALIEALRRSVARKRAANVA